MVMNFYPLRVELTFWKQSVIQSQLCWMKIGMEPYNNVWGQKAKGGFKIFMYSFVWLGSKS